MSKRLSRLAFAIVLLMTVAVSALGSETHWRLPIRAFTSEVLSKSELARLQKTLGIQIGQPPDLKKIRDGIYTLSLGRKYQSIFIDSEIQDGGLNLFVRGLKYRKLTEVKFINVEPDLVDELQRRYSLVEGEWTDARTFSLVRERLKAAYQERGYQFSDVQVELVDGEEDEAELTVRVVPGVATRVGNVNVLGVSKEDITAIRAVVSLRKNDILTKQKLDESSEKIQKFLRGLQFPAAKVSDTSVQFSPDKLTADVTFSVSLGEKIQYQFSGYTVFEEYTLREMLTEEMVSQTDASQRIAKSIEEKYRAVGYHFCRVSPRVFEVPSEKLNVVRLEIQEGPKVLIDRLKVNVNGKDLEEGEVVSLFYESAQGVLARKVYWEAGLNETVQGLRDRLSARGYLSNGIAPPKIIFSDDKKGVQILLDVEPGVRTDLSHYDLKGVTAMTPDEIAEKVGIRPGEPIDRKKTAEGLGNLLSAYRDKGYSDVRIGDSRKENWLELSIDQHKATIFVEVVEGTKYHVGDITVEGNKKTRDEVILREVKVKKGDPFNPTLLRQSEEDISLLGLFSRVEIVSTVDDKNLDQKNLKVVVREMKPGIGELGLGGVYEEPRLRLRAFVGLQYRNLGGLNQTISGRSEIGLPLSKDTLVPFVEHATLLAYRAPYPFSIPVTFTAQVGLDSFEVSTVGPKLQTRARLEGKVEKKLSSKVTGIYRLYRFERTKTEILDTPPPTIDSIGSIGPGVIIDLRNDPFNPTLGSYHTLDLEFASPALLSQSNISFVMLIARNSFFVPLVSPFSLSMFFGGGYAKSLIDGATLPTARMANDLSLGGQASLRGFGVRRFSPEKYAPTESAYLNARAELSTYLFSNFSAALFFDSGQIFPNLKSLGEIRHDGVGVGIRYKTPVGPIVIDVAQGLGRDKENVKFYFTVGTL